MTASRPPLTVSGSTGTFRCDVVRAAGALHPHIKAREQLVDRALEDNLYLTPAFLGATLRNLERHRSDYIVFVYQRTGTEDCLVGVASSKPSGSPKTAASGNPASRR